MRVIGADIYLCSIGGRRPVLVELHTDEGLSGCGDASIAYGLGATAAAGMVKDLAEGVILGQDPRQVEPLWSAMYDHSFWAKGGGPIVYAGISAIEQALLDIKGQALGVPVFELLGGAYRRDVRLYANGWSFRAVTPDEFARATERPLQEGYSALKMYPLAIPLNDAHGRIKHVDNRQLDRETEEAAVAKVRAVRRAIGPDVELMVDMSAELATPDAIRLGRRFEEFGLVWFEEPTEPSDEGALCEVKEAIRIPVAAGERRYGRYGFRALLERRAADILQPDVGNCGGVLEVKRIAAMAEAWSLMVAPHLCASPVATAATLHLDASLPNLLIQELYPYRVAEHWAVVDDAAELKVKNGRMPVPTRPGLGVALDRARLKPFLWASCRAES
ncbi:MAG: mandelate racemase/muconate lactonizing enzyme family protein [Alphaproteobacteria bacterium]|nr:mandelate racemase/muconate lactonizing enzyme family protein [Alphaproteobacteria bacterium]